MRILVHKLHKATVISLFALMTACSGGGGGENANSTPVPNISNVSPTIAGHTITLDGSSSSDADRDTLTYQWELVTAPEGNSATISNPDQKISEITPYTAGSYTVTLRVSDGKAVSEPTSLTFEIYLLNVPPIAEAGSNQTVPVGNTIELDGSSSYDADLDPLIYEWSFVSVASGSTASLSDKNAINPTFITDAVGEYTLQLIVNDGTDTSIADLVTISAIDLVSLEIAPINRSIPLGFNKQYLITGTLSDLSTIDMASLVNWTSSDPSIASIDNLGLATSQSEGIVTISASFFHIEDSTSLTITPVEITEISVTSPTAPLLDGQQIQLYAFATYSDGTTANVTEQLFWEVPFFDANLLQVSNAPGSKGLVSTLGETGIGMVTAYFSWELNSTAFITVQ